MRYLLKLFLAIVLGYFVFFGIIGPSIYSKAIKSLKQETSNHLITVRELKKLELEEYFFERRGDLMVLSKDPLVVESLPLFVNAFKEKGLGSKQYIDAEKEFGTKLTYYTKTYGYEDLFLVDIDGNIVFSAVDESYLGINLLEVDFIDPMIPDIFMQGREKVAFSDYVWFELFNELTSFGAAPIRDRRGDVMGVLIFHLAFRQINDMMSKRPGLGKTGETYLVGEDKLMRSNSRFVEGSTAYQLRVDTEGVREAMKGHAGVSIMKDYRGASVISAYSPLNVEHFNWVILAEIDVAEAFKAIYKLRRFMYIVSGLVCIGVGLYGYLAYRKEMKLQEEEEWEEEGLSPEEIEARQAAYAAAEEEEKKKKKKKKLKVKVKKGEKKLKKPEPGKDAKKEKTDKVVKTEKPAEIKEKKVDTSGKTENVAKSVESKDKKNRNLDKPDKAKNAEKPAESKDEKAGGHDKPPGEKK